MRTIHKFTLEVTGEQTITAPAGCEPLSVQMQNGQLQLWCKVDTDQPTLPHKVQIFGTGHDISKATGYYMGTFQSLGGSFVGHVYFTPTPNNP